MRCKVGPKFGVAPADGSKNSQAKSVSSARHSKGRKKTVFWREMEDNKPQEGCEQYRGSQDDGQTTQRKQTNQRRCHKVKLFLNRERPCHAQPDPFEAGGEKEKILGKKTVNERSPVVQRR